MNDYVEKCSACNGYKPIDEDLTGVPDEFRECDISKFNWDLYGSNISFAKDVVESFISKFKEWALKGEGLYFYSKTAGSGKTFLACCIGKSVMMKYNIRFKFITITDYIEKVSEGYSMQKQGIGGSSPAEIYKECELLVLDDMGTSIDKPWQTQEIFKLVNSRLQSGKPTIYTSNLEPTKLSIDERIKSRINGTSIVLPIPEVSIRQIKQMKYQQDFVKNMLGKGKKNE